jgi:cytochrome P450
MRPPALDATHFAEPEAFRPERWLAGPDRPAGASSAKRVAMPFGAGPRLCPGRYLAMLEMKMVMAMLLASFDIESVGAGPHGGEPKEHLAFTMYPEGLRLKLRNSGSE